MNPNITVTEAFNVEQVPFTQRDLVAGISAARMVAYKAPLPAAAVADPSEYYDNNCYAQAAQQLSDMNEVCVFDFDLALAFAKNYWLARYALVYDPSTDAAIEAVNKVVAGNLAAHDTAAFNEITPAVESMSDVFGRLWSPITATPPEQKALEV